MSDADAGLVIPAQDLSVRFDPISEAYIGNPAGSLGAARDSAPVFYSDKMECWVVARYADVQAALLDFETYSNATLAAAPVPPEFQNRVPTDFFSKSFNAMDPPDHNPVRKMGHSGFTRERLASFAALMTCAAEELIDGFRPAGQCELMGAFCHELSHRTITAFLGLPSTDIPRLKQLAEDLPRAFTGHLTPMDEAETRERWGRIADLRDYFREVIARRRREPGDDFTTMLIRAADDLGEPLLTDDRIITHMTEIVFAGTDTTANLIASAVLLLDRHPDQLQKLKSNPGLVANAIEEVLRMRGSVNGLFRKVTRDVQLAGQEIPAGSLVYLAIASAGQDAGQFSRPETFDIERREAPQHLAFGKGRHLCIGAPLARMEARVALTALYGTLPDLRVAQGQRLEHDPILLSVMLKSLRVEW
jgi:cytochrome P450